jgi:hypothetical protein
VSEEDKVMVRRIVEGINAGVEEATVDELFDPRAARRVKRLFAEFRTAFPDWQEEIVQLVAEGAAVAGRFRCSGRVTGRRGSGGYEVHEEQLDAVKARILRSILSGELEGWEDLSLNYIETATLRDREGRIVLRISDMGEEILYSLPEPERSALIERFAGEGIPEEVIEQVAVNEDKLHP